MTSFGDATRMEMPNCFIRSKTSWKSIFRLDLARERARPYTKQTFY